MKTTKTIVVAKPKRTPQICPSFEKRNLLVKTIETEEFIRKQLKENYLLNHDAE